MIVKNRARAGFVPTNLSSTRSVSLHTRLSDYTHELLQLKELMDIHQNRPTEDDRWRVYSYGKGEHLFRARQPLTDEGTTAIRALRDLPTAIRSYEEALSIKGVGEKTALKVVTCD